MIIALHGHSRAGKDETANILKDYGFKRLAFGDNIRTILLDLNPPLPDIGMSLRDAVEEFGWDEVKAKSRESVELMIRLGQGARDHIDTNIWVSSVIPHLTNRCNYVITDCRQANEVEAIQERGGYLWKIVRPGTEPRGMDQLLEDFQDWDNIILNDATLTELRINVDHALSELKSHSTKDSMDRYKARKFKEDPDWRRRTHLQRRYGLTMEEFDQKLEEQDGVCALCLKRPQALLAVDHDHRCCPGLNSCGDCIRGLLCTGCNMMVGVIENDPEWAERAITWLDTRWRTEDD